MGLTHSPRIATDGLVLCLDAGNVRSYPGSGSVWSDLSNANNNAELQNTPGYVNDNGGGIDLPGTNEYIKIPRNTSLEPSAITLECAFVMDSWTSYPGIISKGYGPESNFNGIVYEAGYSLHVRPANENYRLFVMFYNNGSRVNLQINAGIEMNKIQHIIVTIGSDGYTVWNKGLLKASNSTSYSISHDDSNGGTQKADLFIGMMHYSPSTRMNGRIFLSRIYNRALSTNEIKQNYLATKGRFNL
jgi:hypothetical protein